MIYPEFPSKGDVIGICAPSAGVGGKIESFDLSIDTLTGAGFGILETESVRSVDYPSASAIIRGREFNEVFADDGIKAVICASGGDYTSEMLPYIDANLLRTDPKWFIGYSDPTSIELFLTTKLDIASIYGINAGSLDWRPLHPFQENALKIISGDIVKQTSFEYYSLAGFSEEGYALDTPVEWKTIWPLSASDAGRLDVTGRLIGGCIDVIDAIIGTEFEDLRGFADRYASDGLIWYFDPFEMSPLRIFYALQRMKFLGLFDNAKAIVFGRVFLPGESTDEEYIEQIQRVFEGLDIPIVWGADIGHTKPSFMIINGAIGHLAMSGGKAELEMSLK